MTDGASPFNYFSPVIEIMHADERHAAELRSMALAQRWGREVASPTEAAAQA